MGLPTRCLVLSVRGGTCRCALPALIKTGLFYAGYAAILTPSFGIIQAYGDDTAQLNNALGFFMIRK